MTIDELIVTLLLPLAPITPMATADKTKIPRITYMQVATIDHQNLRDAGPERGRYQIDVWALDLKTARLLATSAKVALRAGLTIGAVTGNPDDYEVDTKLHRASFDIAAWPTTITGATP